MSNFGMKVSVLGKSTLSKRREDVLFDSTATTVPIRQEIPFKITVPFGQQGGNFEIEHGLSFMPLVRAWIDNENETARNEVPGRTDSFYSFVFSMDKKIIVNLSSTSPGWYAGREYIFKGFLYIYGVGI